MSKLLKLIQFILLTILFMVLGTIIMVKFFNYGSFNFIPQNVFGNTILSSEIIFTLNLIILSIVLAVLMFFINKFLLKNISKWSMLLSLVIFFPIVNWLYLMAGIADESSKEYIPRSVWVFTPIIVYVIILIILNLIKEKNIIDRIKQIIKKGVPIPIILTLIINWFLIIIIYSFLKSSDLQNFIIYLKRTFSFASIGILLITILSIFTIIKYSVKLRFVLIVSNYIFIIYFLDLLCYISTYRLYEIIKHII